MSINTSRTGDVRSVTDQVNQYKLKPFATMLDASGATLRAYGVPKNAPNWLVVIDANGKIAFNASKGWHWTDGPNAGKFCHEVAIDESVKNSPGILQIPSLPDEFSTAAHLFDLQQFDLVDQELRNQQSTHAHDQLGKDAIAKFYSRIADSRKLRVAHIKEEVASDPMQAYRDAVAYCLAFDKAPERPEVNKLGRQILKDKTVRRELDAENAYKQVLVPIMIRTSTLNAFDRNLQPVLDQYMQTFGGTEFGKIAQAAVEAHGDAIRHPNH